MAEERDLKPGVPAWPKCGLCSGSLTLEDILTTPAKTGQSVKANANLLDSPSNP